jgi:hypothetical protein
VEGVDVANEEEIAARSSSLNEGGGQVGVSVLERGDLAPLDQPDGRAGLRRLVDDENAGCDDSRDDPALLRRSAGEEAHSEFPLLEDGGAAVDHDDGASGLQHSGQAILRPKQASPLAGASKTVRTRRLVLV